MPFYQQEWLQQTLQRKSRNKHRSTISGAASERGVSPEFNPQNDPLMYSILNPPTKEEIRKTSLGFYEDKLTNRDSGTDSPTCNNYDDQNMHELIKKLDLEHTQLANGERGATQRVSKRDIRSQGNRRNTASGYQLPADIDFTSKVSKQLSNMENAFQGHISSANTNFCHFLQKLFISQLQKKKI